MSKHIWVSESFTNKILFIFFKELWNLLSEGKPSSEFSCFNFKVQHVILCSQWLPVSPFPQSSRLPAIFHLENNANSPPLWITGKLGLLTCAYIWPSWGRWYFWSPPFRLDKEMDCVSLVREIIAELHLVEARAQNHTLEASNFTAWKNHSFWGLHLALMAGYHELPSNPKTRHVNIGSMLLDFFLHHHVLSLLKPYGKQ